MSNKKQMKSNLSQILPVVEACHILGKDSVARLVRSFLSFRTPSRPPTNEDVAVLVKALFFDPGENDVPQNIQNNWNRMTRRTSGLDKPSFLKFMIPAPAAPYNAPGGHLGLFDCWVHALSASASNYPANGAGGPNALQPVVLLPDILIVVAMCREYKTIQSLSSRATNNNTVTEDLASRADYATMMLSILAYRVYDSYQKKGYVARDAVHRFLSDVHGEDSYKTTSVRKMLDIMYAAPEQQQSNKKGDAASPFLPHLTPSQFANGIRKTSPRHRHHILLDWMATLGDHMVPVAPLPVSVNAYLDTLTSSNRSLETLCTNYGLANLYEIKRRFHSLVETNLIVQGDVMKEASQEDENDKNSGSSSRKPRHVISQHAFCTAAHTTMDDMGHGGYLPEKLAQLVFHHGACPMGDDDDTSPRFWALFDILQFGCDAVRQFGDKIRGDITAELPLMRFAFRVFGGESGIRGAVKRDLTRNQVGQMLMMVLEHQIFRFEMDRPYYEDDKEGSDKIPPIVKNEEDLEKSLIDVSAASMLGILPQERVDYSRSKQVSLGSLVDACLDTAGMEGDTLAFDGFCKWHYSKDASDLPLSQRRVGPFLVELRLIASVLFGVPPTRASMEESLIQEIQRRQKYRYPQTDVARRGPRGTIWYIIEDKWFKRWMEHVQRVAGNDGDLKDGREIVGADSRSLGKINNTFLLADNGTLALKSDIRWRHDYEIVPPLAWSALQAWYDGGPPIHRSVVRYIPSNGAPSVHSRSPRVRTEFEIELYPFFVTVFMCDASSRGEARPFQQYAPVSRVSPVGVFLVQLCKGLDVDPKLGRIWMMESLPGDPTTEGAEDWLLNLELNVMEQRNRRSTTTAGEALSANRITLLLELKDPESGKWPRGLDGKTWTFGEKQRYGELNRRPGEPDTGTGIVGLYNMGNTCYLNSSIQCLSHTPIFRDYFTSKVYLNDINTTNPLGHQGRLAQVSAVLINSVWKRFNQNQTASSKRITAPGSYAPVSAPALTPKTFKDSLGKFNEHFAGNEQHDAQELLAFLLGGLSEDLNRIVDKPYIEAPDSDGRPDSELADIWWSNHLKREMSIIVALFTGQYKSLLTCRSCKYESARFEPFSFLQLPLPEDDQISVSLVFYPITEKTQILKYSIRVRHDGKLLDVLMALSRVLHSDETGERLTIGPGATGDDKSDDVDVDEEFEELMYERAQTMAVVDMRDGYIFKIAPNTWALPDLQNKDTGELPMLHVYELDPLPADDDEHEDEEEDVEEEETTEEEEVADEEVVKEEITEEEETLEEEDDENVVAVEEEEEEHKEETVEGDIEDEADDDEEEAYDDETEESEEDDETEEEVDENKFKVMSVNDEGEEEGGLQGADDEEEDSENSTKYSFLALAQRRVEFSNRDVVHPFTHQVFGTPLLLRVVDLEGHTGSELYSLVAQRLQPLVPRSALRFLQGAHSAPAKGESSDAKPDPKAVTRQRRQRTLSEMESVAAGPVPRYGFRLRITSREGRRCALCPWYQCCIGCQVPDDDYPTIVSCGDSVSIDWHFAVDVATNGFGTRLNQPDQPVPQSPFRVKTPSTISIKNHASCNDDAKKKGRYGNTITLEDCLDAFAKEEKIPEAYCSSCKDFRVQTKHMSLWRLPPIVIIQLKRFQFTQHARRKLRDLVDFPVEGLDLSRILAPDSAGATLEVKRSAPPLASSEAETNTTMGTDDPYLNGGGDDYIDPLEGGMNPDGEYVVEDVVDDDGNEEEDDPMSSSSYSGRTTGAMLYDLYAVVHHQGALSGGHYVASLKSEIDGQWRLFNDAQVYEIHSRDVVDSSAYILFYIRRDVKDAKLQDFWDIRARVGKGLTEEEVESLMKGRSDRCVIS